MALPLRVLNISIVSISRRPDYTPPIVSGAISVMADNAMASQHSSCPFLQLPREIRDLVYQHW